MMDKERIGLAVQLLNMSRSKESGISSSVW